MIVSLNEIAATAMKAVRGCGHPLGLAEEMAFATRWLCERNLRGAEKLVHALEQYEQSEVAVDRREKSTSLQLGDDKAGSPLLLAPSIADLLVADCDHGKSVHVSALAHPLLLIPFVARVGQQYGLLQLSWTTIDNSTVVVNCDQAGVQIYAWNPFSLIQARGNSLVLRWAANDTDVPVLNTRENLLEVKQRSIDTGCELADAVWHKLQVFAHNTYVPVSDESRLKGAGAGLTDND